MKQYFYSIGKLPLIDEPNGIIRNVSLIKSGEAEGHFDKKGRQEVVDDTTLLQVFTYCRKAESVKVKADHGSGVLSTIGYVDEFAMTADKVLATFHIYDSEPSKDRIFEIATKNPDHMGFSLEFEGADVHHENKSFSRCERVLAVALVSDPAANTSLFSALPPEETETPNQNTDMADTENTTPSAEDRLTKLEETLTNMAKRFDEKFPAAPDADDAAAPDAVATDAAAQPAGTDPKKTYTNPDADVDSEETKKIELAVQRGIEKGLKTFAANVGTQPLKAPGQGGQPVKEPKFDDMVKEEAAKHGGCEVKAYQALLKRLSDPVIMKAYQATRLVKQS